MKRIRLINTFEPVSNIWDYLLPALNEKGYDAKAIVSQGKYSQGRPSRIEKYLKKLYNLPFLRKKKWANHASYGLLIIPMLLFSKKQLNIIYTQPPFYFPILAFVSKVRGNPYIIHIMDLQPELFGAIGQLPKTGLFYKMTKRAGDWALRNAQEVIVIGRCMKDLCLTKGVDERRVSVVTNIASVEEFNKTQKSENPFLKAQGIADKFIVLYSGNMGFGHEFQTILQVASELKDKKEILFLFIGKGERRAEIEEYINAHPGENVKLMGFLPAEDLPHSIGGADVHFICLRAGLEGIMVPSKTYNCMASGAPILYEGPESSEVFRELEEKKCGQSIPYKDKDALKSAILNYYQNRETTLKHGENARKTHQTFYSPTYFVQSYLKAIKKTEQ